MTVRLGERFAELCDWAANENLEDALEIGYMLLGLDEITVGIPNLVDELSHPESKTILAQKRYVYWWTDGVYSNVRMDNKLCLLVIVGVTEHGHKELVAVEDGHRESEASWLELHGNRKALDEGVATPQPALPARVVAFKSVISERFAKSQSSASLVKPSI